MIASTGRDLEPLMPNDPLLQPFKLKHLTLRNRLMTSSHEPG